MRYFSYDDICICDKPMMNEINKRLKLRTTSTQYLFPTFFRLLAYVRTSMKINDVDTHKMYSIY